MPTCEECGAPCEKILRCTKCKACCYCSKACQTRNWRLHKRVCSADPGLRPFIRVEMAIERALAKQPKIKAPKDATCYICLEGDSKSSKLLRGCACRGDSAGFVHFECLVDLAVSKEELDDAIAARDRWNVCGNCNQGFTGVLELNMVRRCWRRHRSGQYTTHQGWRYMTLEQLAKSLIAHDEEDAANLLFDEASKIIENDEQDIEMKLQRAEHVSKRNGQDLEALELLQAILPKARAYTEAPALYFRTLHQLAEVLIHLGRNHEAHEVAGEAVTFTTAKFGREDLFTVSARKAYATACARLGHVDESKSTFEDIISTSTRILGRDHPATKQIREWAKYIYEEMERDYGVPG